MFPDISYSWLLEQFMPGWRWFSQQTRKTPPYSGTTAARLSGECWSNCTGGLSICAPCTSDSLPKQRNPPGKSNLQAQSQLQEKTWDRGHMGIELLSRDPEAATTGLNWKLSLWEQTLFPPSCLHFTLLIKIHSQELPFIKGTFPRPKQAAFPIPSSNLCELEIGQELAQEQRNKHHLATCSPSCSSL